MVRDCGMWSLYLYVNTTTSVLHTEDDCSYTVISIPAQNKEVKRYPFLFKINADEMIKPNMNTDLSFIFSGKNLLHRQSCSTMDNNHDKTFINISSYDNKKLFTHMHKSFARNMHDE